MNLLAITPDEFQALALAWISAITVVGGAAVGFIVFIYGKISAIKQSTQDTAQRLDDHSRRISGNSQTVARIALQVSPPTDREELHSDRETTIP